MKKLSFAFALLISCATLSAATTDSLLYWMIGDSINTMKGPVSGADLAGYKVKLGYNIGEGNTYLNLYGDLSDLDVTAKEVGANDATGPLGLYAGVGELSDSTSIFVELLNLNDEFAGVRNLGTVGSLSQYIASMSGMTDPVTKAIVADLFTIPEPTSGLLMLLGCAALALRRRKMLKV